MKNKILIVVLLALLTVTFLGILSVNAQVRPQSDGQTLEELKPADFPSLQEYYKARIKAIILLIKEAYIAGNTDLVSQLMDQLSTVIQEAVDNIPNMTVKENANFWNIYNVLSTVIESAPSGTQIDTLFAEVENVVEEEFSVVEIQGTGIILPGAPIPEDHS
ncbi:MAG: hypothetical protein AB9907_03290 [Flexilinea sp.]